MKNYLKQTRDDLVEKVVTFGTPYNGGNRESMAMFHSGNILKGMFSAGVIKGILGASPSTFNIIPIREAASNPKIFVKEVQTNG